MRLFDLHLFGCSNRSVLSGGKLIWRDHPAKARFIKYTESIKAQTMNPKHLRRGFTEYMHFSFDDFKKYVYQEKYRPIAGTH